MSAIYDLLRELRLEPIDPGYLDDDSPTPMYRPCAGCGVRRGTQVHHKTHKAMGGRHGAAKRVSEDPSNKILLCEICHAASHYEHAIAPDGFHCGVCPLLDVCRYGRVTLGLDPGELPAPW